jgi:uncharacterized protein (TIGR02246 family)
MSDDERSIRELLTKWFDATEKGDTQTVLSLMTDDVVFMVPGREPFGKEAFERTSDDMLETFEFPRGGSRDSNLDTVVRRAVSRSLVGSDPLRLQTHGD